MKTIASCTSVLFFSVLTSHVAAGDKPQGITRSQADALALALTKKDPYIGSSPYPLKNDGNEPGFYGYQLLVDAPREPSQNAGTIMIDKKTGAIILDGGACFLYPMKLGAKPLTAASGINRPSDCE